MRDPEETVETLVFRGFINILPGVFPGPTDPLLLLSPGGAPGIVLRVSLCLDGILEPDP